jgi:hypothetical protein
VYLLHDMCRLSRCSDNTMRRSVTYSFIHSLRLGYGLNDGGVGIRFPVEARYSLPHNVQTVQTGYGAYAASHTMDNAQFSPGVKRQGHETDYSSPPSTDIKNDEAIPSLHVRIQDVIQFYEYLYSRTWL